MVLMDYDTSVAVYLTKLFSTFTLAWYNIIYIHCCTLSHHAGTVKHAYEGNRHVLHQCLLSGNFGNKLDKNVPAQSSTTPPTNPIRYGSFHHYLPWMDQKPCVVVDSHWEDNGFRIDSMNLLNLIADRLVNKSSSLP